MKYTLKSIRIWSFFKVSILFNLIIGFIFGLLYALIIVPMLTFISRMPGFPAGQDMNLDGASFGVLLILLPLMGAFFGAVFHTIIGMILILAYNMVVKLTGGLEFDLGNVELEARPEPGHNSYQVPPAYPEQQSYRNSPPPPPAPPKPSRDYPAPGDDEQTQ